MYIVIDIYLYIGIEISKEGDKVNCLPIFDLPVGGQSARPETVHSSNNSNNNNKYIQDSTH